MPENFEDIKNTLEDSAEAYDRNVDAANNLPVWFSDVSRTRGTRNITVELWNTLCQNIAKLASDSTSQNEYVKAVTSALIDTITNVDSITQTLIQFSQKVNEHNPVQYVSFNETSRTLTLRPLDGDDVVLNFNITSTIVDSEIVAPKLPTAAAVVKYFDTVSKPFFKIPSVPDLTIQRYVCGIESSTREQLLIPANTGVMANSLVYRDPQGMFHVKTPTVDTHPVNLSYFNEKSNNSLYNEYQDLKNEISFLQEASNGTVYRFTKRTVLASNGEGAIQVGNALDNGIWIHLPSWSFNVKLPFNCLLATVGNTSTTVPHTINSVTFKQNNAYFLKMPVNITNATVKVYCDGENSYGEYISKYNFYDTSDKLIQPNSVQIGKSYTIPEGVTAKYLLLYKDNPTDKLKEDLVVTNIRLYTTDLNAGVYELQNSVITDESGMSEVINLLPSAIVEVATEGSNDDYFTFEYVQRLPEEGV